MIMEGRDTVAMARTGSGKTAAFLLPMLDRLKGHSEMGARALIMSPTRELALQTLKFTKEVERYLCLFSTCSLSCLLLTVLGDGGSVGGGLYGFWDQDIFCY